MDDLYSEWNVKRAGRILLAGWIVALSSAASLGPGQEAVSPGRDVRKVLGHIEKIRRAGGRDPGAPRRSVSVTEEELNAFIAYSFEIGGEEITKELRLKLLDDNQLEGMIRVDLRGTSLPRILRPDMTFFFSGRLETRPGQGRLILKRLFLENQSIPLSTLDLVIYVASKISSTKATTLKDWYDLPYGIQDIETYQGRAAFFY